MHLSCLWVYTAATKCRQTQNLFLCHFCFCNFCNLWKDTRMKNLPRALGAATLAAILGVTSSAAFAQPNGYPGQRDDGRRGHRGPNVQQPRPQHNAGPSHRPMQPGYRDGHRDDRYATHGQRGAGPQHNWYRGGRVPPSYRSYGYVVNDWRGHRLSAPPRGYHWIQNGSDYLLIAIATGVIAQLILSN